MANTNANLIPPVIFNAVGKTPKSATFEFTPDEVKEFVADAASRYLSVKRDDGKTVGVTPDNVHIEVITVKNSDAVRYDEETKRSTSDVERVLTIQITLNADNPHITGDYIESLGTRPAYYDQDFKEFCKLYCKVNGDNYGAVVDGAKDARVPYKRVILSPIKVFRNMLDCAGYLYKKTTGEGHKPFSIDIETTYRNKELTDRNLIIRSFIVTKYQENTNVSGRTPTKNAKKIKSVQ